MVIRGVVYCCYTNIIVLHVSPIEFPVKHQGLATFLWIGALPKPDAATVYPASWFHWVDLRENLQETIEFPMKYGIFV